MIGLSVILICDSCSHNLGKRNIGGHMLYTQVKGVLQHVNLNIQSFFGKGILKCRGILSHDLRIGDIVRFADGYKLGPVIYGQLEFAVQAVLSRSQV